MILLEPTGIIENHIKMHSSSDIMCHECNKMSNALRNCCNDLIHGISNGLYKRIMSPRQMASTTASMNPLMTMDIANGKYCSDKIELNENDLTCDYPQDQQQSQTTNDMKRSKKCTGNLKASNKCIKNVPSERISNRRSNNNNGISIKLSLLLLYLGLFGKLVTLSVQNSSFLVAADSTSPANGTLKTESDICGSFDIKNHGYILQQLKNCRVIEGFLMITLMDKSTEDDFQGLTFPKLTEITDFLIVYRVGGLKSIGQLFPNLAVIRGNNLFRDYALVVYMVPNLENLGLHSLISISRGGVRIEKNNLLCFTDTIDWKRIARNASDDEIVMVGNSESNVCATCEQSPRTNNGKRCLELPNKKTLCWNANHCQRICPSNCSFACNDKGECCDESCLDTCIGTKDNCTICRHFSLGNHNERRCVDHCPANTYLHMNRRCITADECRNIPQPIGSPPGVPKNPYFPFENKCSMSCPNGYDIKDYKDGDRIIRGCEKCYPGPCRKDCKGLQIDTIQSAASLTGCTHITGGLIINIKTRATNMVVELERSLPDIQEIDGFLKVSRSYPLVSLSFFKSLRAIRGNTLESGLYSLYVYSNDNLMELFPNPVNITKGRVFFHLNPRLCIRKIKELAPYVSAGIDFDKNHDIGLRSNGDKTACNITHLEAKVEPVFHLAAVVTVEPIVYFDDRTILAYVANYIEAPYQNVSLYDNRDACFDSWMVMDNTNVLDRKITFFINKLKPFTQYAIYVKTTTIGTDTQGGQSDIMYFTTLPAQPSKVRNLRTTHVGSDELLLEWLAPAKPNGNLNKYIIVAKLRPDNPNILKTRDYCKTPIEVDIKNTPVIIPSIEKEKLPEDGCNCRKLISGTDAEDNQENFIDFENELHNVVYIKRVIGENVKRDNSNRSKRSIASWGIDADNHAMEKYWQSPNQFDNITHGMTREHYNRFIEHHERKRERIRLIRQALDNNDTIAIQQHLNIKPMPPDMGEKFPESTVNKSNVEHIDTESKKIGNYYEYVYKVINATGKNDSVLLTGLKHYSLYWITVKACREGINDVERPNCSDVQQLEQRTSRSETADDVKNLKYEILPLNSSLAKRKVKLTWSVPKDPNSLIVSYNVRYHRHDIDNFQPPKLCFPNVGDNIKISNGLASTIIDLTRGNYSVEIQSTSLAGDSNYTSPQYFYLEEESDNTYLWIILGIVMLMIGCFVSILWMYLHNKRETRRKEKEFRLYANVNPDYMSVPYVADEWERPRERIIQLNELGQGSFGMVYEGIYRTPSEREISCAIKTVNENATDKERLNFLKEASVMKSFDTNHVVHLLGVVSAGQPTLVIMELMSRGDLKGYLRSMRPDESSGYCSGTNNEPPPHPPTLKQILQMAIEIADGMAYLAAKKFVHRDLAARNCMVADDLTVKIGDFGMTRDIYETDYYRKGTKGLLPVRWMAPESLKDGIFSSSSDVFSYGVVLWEMATLASQPYQGLSNDQVLKYVIDGGIMERPENCPDQLYNLMIRCWQHRPFSRPTFLHIVKMLCKDAKENFHRVSYFHSEAGQDLLAQLPTSRHIDMETTPLRAAEEMFHDTGSLDSDEVPINGDDGFPMQNIQLSALTMGITSTPEIISTREQTNRQHQLNSITDSYDDDQFNTRRNNGDIPSMDRRRDNNRQRQPWKQKFIDRLAHSQDKMWFPWRIRRHNSEPSLEEVNVNVNPNYVSVAPGQTTISPLLGQLTVSEYITEDYGDNPQCGSNLMTNPSLPKTPMNSLTRTPPDIPSF